MALPSAGPPFRSLSRKAHDSQEKLRRSERPGKSWELGGHQRQLAIGKPKGRDKVETAGNYFLFGVLSWFRAGV